MKTSKIFLLLTLIAILFLPGCEVIVGIFKAGFWTAIILILLIVGLAMWGFRKFRGPR